MGGAVPGVGFIVGMFVGPLFVGYLMGRIEQSQPVSNPSLLVSLIKHLQGTLASAALLAVFVIAGGLRQEGVGIPAIAPLLTWCIVFSVLPWLIFGGVGRKVGREAGKDRL